MTNSKSTKRSLLMSAMSMLLCVSMLLGTTFAWFTDTVTSANNIIKSGNLDIELDYWDGNSWETVQGASDILTNKLWEPGVTEVAYLRLTNEGSLALKYQLGVNIVSEETGTNVAGETFKLSDYIYFDVIEGIDGEKNPYNRETVKKVTTQKTKISAGYTKSAEMKADSDPLYLALVVHMPTTVTNEANYKTSDEPSNPDKYRPQIDLGINVVATQLASENDSFGPDYDKDALVKGQKITSGTYSVNPAEYDETLSEPDSEYIAIEFEKNGRTQWIVDDRATTVVLAPDEQSARTIKNYTIKSASGKLWSIIRDLQNNEHTTVYLLPGTYSEATTIYVYSNMDIIGLGDIDAVKVVKQSSSDSNRHLFNVSGTKEDYIQVTLQNMYLDSVAKTTGGKSNAAVQSIRKSKVKCFDLTINNGSGWEDDAFYVNGNNAVDGVKYTAYMYVENCTVKTNQVLNTAGSYKFYHHNLKYNDGANYNDSTKKQMSADDWEW